MFERTKEHKVMRDPIHGYINVYYQVIWDCINTFEFQRLRRIHQLGGTLHVYHTAEHSRFGHSLGVYEITRLMIENIEGLKETLNEREQVALLCASLLHDIGHGPFSHAFESISGIDHEQMSDRIILENTHINRVLKEVDDNFPQMVADIIAHRYPRALLSQMISSQMDADRMDYLLRDSYFTGVSYGKFDLFRILRTIRIVDDMLVVKESGIHAIEDYIMARYQMYWQVYLHPTSRSYEALLHSIFKRMKDLYQEAPHLLNTVPVFVPFLNNKKIVLNDFLKLDETSTLAGFMELTQSEDPILQDLSKRILSRDLFGYMDLKDKGLLDKIRGVASKHGYDPNYYVTQDFMSQSLYLPYQEFDKTGVWILKDDVLVELSKASIIVGGFVLNEEKEDRKVFYPKELNKEL